MGRYRLEKVKTEWSPELAYAIGLITTDGNLSPDGRHIHLTSKDEEIVLNFQRCLNLSNKIGKKARGGSQDKRYFVIQFGDKSFYEFLLSLGLCPAKSKKLPALKIPDPFFADFLRGCIDGDGSISLHSHPESRYPQLRIRLFSASPIFMRWIQDRIRALTGIEHGWIEKKECVEVLVYATADSLTLFRFIYYDGVNRFLLRKRQKLQEFFGRVAKLV